MANDRKPIPKYYIWVCLIVFVILCGLLGLIYSSTGDLRNISLWLAGAGALGLLSGHTTGASSQVGAASEFLKFVSGGILLPLFGGIATLLSGSGDTANTLSNESIFYSLEIIGGFLFFYSLFAIIGLIVGAKSRTDGIEITLARRSG